MEKKNQQSAPLLLTPFEEPRKSLVKDVKSKLPSIPNFVIDAAVEGYHAQIRAMDEGEAQNQLLVIIPQVAQAYGARQKMPPYTVAECVSLVFDHFHSFGLNEIEASFRYNASQQSDGNEVYGGEFNATYLGRVLRRYEEEVRRPSLKEYIDANWRMMGEEHERRRRSRLQREFDIQWEEEVKKMRERKDEISWKDIPLFWFESAKKRKLIPIIKEEMERVMEEAREIQKAVKQLEIEEAKATMTLHAVRSIMRNPQKDDEEAARNIARKMWVKKYLIDEEGREEG